MINAENSNTVNSIKPERKPRTKKSSMEQVDAAQKELRNAYIALAKDVLQKLPDFAKIKDAVKLHRKWIAEGNALLNDTKYNDRVNSLNERLNRLEQKRTIAQSDTKRREEIMKQFDLCKEKVGQLLINAIDNNKEVSEKEIAKIFNDSISESDKQYLKDITDPFASYRHEKKQNDAALTETDESNTSDMEGTDLED